jgi:long-subunit acyl-CoA synthetase (AMP-forming)
MTLKSTYDLRPDPRNWFQAAVVNYSNRVLARGERGEVLVRGYSVMLCYWGSEDQTKAEITPDRWYHTG